VEALSPRQPISWRLDSISPILEVACCRFAKGWKVRMIHLVRDVSLLGALTRGARALALGPLGIAGPLGRTNAQVAEVLPSLPAARVPARLTRSWPGLRRRRCARLAAGSAQTNELDDAQTGLKR